MEYESNTAAAYYDERGTTIAVSSAVRRTDSTGTAGAPMVHVMMETGDGESGVSMKLSPREARALAAKLVNLAGPGN